MKKVELGNNIKVHYKGTLADGTEFDNSYARGMPLTFEVGTKNMIVGFDNAVIGMSEGQYKTVTVPYSEAYGPRMPDASQTVPKDSFPSDFIFETDTTVQGNGPAGPFLATIVEYTDTNVTLDMNHPLAGKDLTFTIELLEIKSENHGVFPPGTQGAATTTMLTGLKVAELRAVAKERGFKGYTKLKKSELLELLSV